MSRQFLVSVVLGVLISECVAQNEGRLMAELDLANLELQDDCEYAAAALERSLVANTFADKSRAMIVHAQLLQMQIVNLKGFDGEVPEAVLRNWTLLVKPGDVLLPPDDWARLVDYSLGLDEITHIATVNCDKNGENCLYVKQGYENMLEKSRNESLLRKSWMAWQSLVSLKRNNYSKILNLIPKAAIQNDFADVRTYWEMLVEQEAGYQLAENIWQDIKPLYTKLHNFVKTRLFRFYNVTEKTHIPVYLLGSNFGADWSSVIDIILPYPQLLNTADNFLKQVDIQQIYKLAEEVAVQLSLKPLGHKFWTNSRFNMTFCENHLLSFCVQEYTELLTCPKTTWSSYLDAHEVAIDAALRNQDYLGLARNQLRFSVVDEAVKGFGPVFGIYNMRHKKIWDPEMFESADVVNHFEIAELLLIALRVLPRLPFYLAADKWRMDLIDRGIENGELRWWKYRKGFQGVEGVANNETDFLGDSFLTSNKPYLHKFLGTILMFHLLENYKTNENSASNIGTDENFGTMMHEKTSRKWSELIDTYYTISELSATPLLEFFAPLEAYLDSSPADVIFPTTTPKPVTSTRQVIKEEQNDQELIELTTNFAVENSTEETQVRMRENPNESGVSLQTISMYVGLALLGIVGFLILFVIGKKITKRKRTTNNRRFET